MEKFENTKEIELNLYNSYYDEVREAQERVQANKKRRSKLKVLLFASALTTISTTAILAPRIFKDVDEIDEITESMENLSPESELYAELEKTKEINAMKAAAEFVAWPVIVGVGSTAVMESTNALSRMKKEDEEQKELVK